MTIHEQQPHTSSVMAPIQYLERDHDQSLPTPLIRIYTLGLLTIDVLEEVIETDTHPQGRYQRLTPLTERTLEIAHPNLVECYPFDEADR